MGVCRIGQNDARFCVCLCLVLGITYCWVLLFANELKKLFKLGFIFSFTKPMDSLYVYLHSIWAFYHISQHMT